MVGVAALVLAMVVRWPVSLYVEALPLDANTALHVLSARDLATGGSPGRLEMLGFPEGAPVRLLAWPILALAAPLATVLSSIVAFNIAVVVWLALQGVAVHVLCRSEGWPRAGSALAGLAVMVAPSVLLALGNGQYENVVVLPIVLAVVGARKAGLAGWGWCTAGLLLAVFSTPYQAIVAGTMALAAGVVAGGLRRAASVLAAGALAAGLAFPYFVAETFGGTGTVTGPGPSAHVEPAAVGYLAHAGAHPPRPVPALANASERLRAAATPPTRRPISGWDPTMPLAASYLGIPAFLGLAGLWRGRREPLLIAAAAGGLACFILALGSQLTFWPGKPTGIPLPWGLAAHVPRLDGIQATHRFLLGVAIALALGLGRLVGSNAVAAATLALAVLADGLLRAPTRWPVPAAAPRVATLRAALPDGPIAVWPGLPAVSADRHAVMAVALDRPLASFDMAEEFGQPPTRGAAGAAMLNRLGETPDAWLTRVREAGAVAFLVLPTPAGLESVPYFSLPPTDVEGISVWTLDDSGAPPSGASD